MVLNVKSIPRESVDEDWASGFAIGRCNLFFRLESLKGSRTVFLIMIRLISNSLSEG